MEKENKKTQKKAPTKKQEKASTETKTTDRKPDSVGENLLNTFSLKKDQEKLKEIMEEVRDGIPFRGTNLWVLILAILIASIGLNTNSPTVIIGAMLISPLMGPIIGMGVSLAIHDVPLLKRAIGNYLFAIGISLATSLLYFSISPISIAHSEILARTSPTIFDVLIALFGGIAGSIALASTKKGNVVPGVAIATALMPPLCTAGYAIATLNLTYFAGAFYLFVINTVFITASSFIVARLLRFPYKKFLDDKARMRSKKIVLAVVILTMVPSIYFGYDIVQQTQFSERANQFIKHESHINGDYLLSRSIDAKTKTIQLIYGGNPESQEQIKNLQNKLSAYGIADAKLVVKQGLSSLYKAKQKEKSATAIAQKDTEQIKELTAALEKSEGELLKIQNATKNQKQLSQQILKEAKLLYPEIYGIALTQQEIYSASGTKNQDIGYILVRRNRDENQEKNIEHWLQLRTKKPQLKAIFETIVIPKKTENLPEEETQSGAIKTNTGARVS